MEIPRHLEKNSLSIWKKEKQKVTSKCPMKKQIICLLNKYYDERLAYESL
jgi:hypothetical protein